MSYTYTIFNNDLKPVGTLQAKNSLEALEKARSVRLPRPIVENTTLLRMRNPAHVPTQGLEFVKA